MDLALKLAGAAEENQVLNTSTVKQLAAGSGLDIEPCKMSDGQFTADDLDVFKVKLNTLS